jgi:hypothetical protein
MLPYLPPHVTQPKEVKNIYLIQLPERCELSVPQNYALEAVPLFVLYENERKYGKVIASLAECLSRVRINPVGFTPMLEAASLPGVGAISAPTKEQEAPITDEKA